MDHIDIRSRNINNQTNDCDSADNTLTSTTQINNVNQSMNNKHHLQQYRMQYATIIEILPRFLLLIGINWIKNSFNARNIDIISTLKGIFNEYANVPDLVNKFLIVGTDLIVEYKYTLYIIVLTISCISAIITRLFHKEGCCLNRENVNYVYSAFHYLKFFAIILRCKFQVFKITTNCIIIGMNTFIHIYYYKSLEMYKWKNLWHHINLSNISFISYFLLEYLVSILEGVEKYLSLLLLLMLHIAVSFSLKVFIKRLKFKSFVLKLLSHYDEKNE